jgi:hypothetical protein
VVKNRMNLCPILKIANLLSQVRSFGGEKRQMLNFGSQVNCRLWFFMKLVISRLIVLLFISKMLVGSCLSKKWYKARGFQICE